MTPEYRAWQLVIDRCERPENKSYADYGGRGIAIAAEWRHDFPAFLAHVGPRPSPRHTIDRIKNERGYEPGNVRWATRTQQNENKRNNRYLEKDGVRLTMAAWARRLGLSKATLLGRIRRGWAEADVLTPKTRALREFREEGGE